MSRRRLTLRELRKILRSYDVQENRGRGTGSHTLFEKTFAEGTFSYPVPTHSKDVKQCYVDGCRKSSGLPGPTVFRTKSFSGAHKSRLSNFFKRYHQPARPLLANGPDIGQNSRSWDYGVLGVRLRDTVAGFPKPFSRRAWPTGVVCETRPHGPDLPTASANPTSPDVRSINSSARV